MIKLVKSPVVFNEENHTYFLGEKQLRGITGMISRQLFPDKYKGVPDHVMRRAAVSIHNASLWTRQGSNLKASRRRTIYVSA